MSIRRREKTGAARSSGRLPANSIGRLAFLPLTMHTYQREQAFNVFDPRNLLAIRPLAKGLKHRALNSMRSSLSQRTRVLFINSALLAGADTWIHFLLLRNLSQDRFELHAAGQPGSPAPAFDELRAIPGIALRPTYFGPSLWRQSKLQKLASSGNFVRASASLLGLAAYIRRHRIEILQSTDRPRDAIACVLLSALTRAKAIIHAHVNYGGWMNGGVRWALGRADAIVGVSHHTARSFAEAGYRPDRVHAILNAIDPSRWDPSLDPALGRESLGVQPLLLAKENGTP